MKLAQHVSETGKAKAPSASKPLFFQPKLTMNQPNDIYEREADHMADKVMRMKDPSANQDTFFKPANTYTQVQRKCQACKDEDKFVHRKESDGSEVRGGHDLDSYVGSLSSSGQAMPAGSRQFFEPRFGHDFSNVKIHTDPVAAKSAQSINALAYTTGNNIVFNSGQYSPESDSGKKLIAHELTHVVQQGAAVEPKNVQRASASGVGPSDSPGATPVDNPAPAPPPKQVPPAQAPAAGTIDSQTVARLPASHSRTTVGVGEEISLTLSTGTATTAWTATAGSFSQPKGAIGARVLFAAPDTAQKVTVSAEGASIVFTVLAPTGVHMELSSEPPIHTINRPDIGMTTFPFLLPDTVSFYKVNYHEINVPATGSGVFSCLTGKGHCDPAALQTPCGDVPLTTRVIAKKGTQAQATDCVYSSDCKTSAPFASGSLTLDIPYHYNVGTGPFYLFTTVKQVHKLSGSSLTCTKAGASVPATAVSAGTAVNTNCPP